MKELNQWITWREEPRPGSKPAKVPYDYLLGKRVDPKDTGAWLSYDAAVATGQPLGFVFTVSDPYFFLDLDNCREGNAWSPAAMEMLARFPGALVEASVSGQGLHVIGRYSGARPEHGCRSGGWLELYTAERFVAVGTNQIGDCSTDHTAALHSLIVSHFPVQFDTSGDDWTSEPRDDWTGPTDDDELIAKACRTQSMAAQFGDACSFAALWKADELELSKHFPDPERTFNRSSADLALAKHLAYWTGDNCERIERLMRRSALNRDKYDREDWMRMTVQRATGGKVYDYVRPTPARPEPSSSEGLSHGNYQFLTIPDQEQLFKGCIYVVSLNKVIRPDGLLLGKDQFNATMPCHEFARDMTPAAKTTRSPWEAFNQSLSFRQPIASHTCFDPLLPWDEPIEIDGVSYANTYRPINTPRKKGDARPFLEHIARLLPDQRDQRILLSYMAAIVQHKGVKFHWTIVLQGAQGNGKSLITNVLQHALGEHFGKASGTDLGNKFNGWVLDKLLIGIDDVQLSMLAGERLKPMLSDKSIPVQSKGVDQKTVRSCVNFIFTTNHRDAVPKTGDDRRFSVFFTAQQEAADIDVSGVSAVYDWLDGDGYAIVHDWLATWPIPDEFNPATSCKRAPLTSTTDEVIRESLNAAEQEVQDWIDEGCAGFRFPWISRTMFTKRCQDRHPRPKVSTQREILKRLGYVPHPALTSERRPYGRTNNQVRPDFCQAEIWVHKSDAASALGSAAEVVAEYERLNV